MKYFGFLPADILVPQNVDMTKWSCVACDQYTSEPEYWNEVENIVGSSPSSLRLMLPEIYLDCFDRLAPEISKTMREYIDKNVFRTVSDSYIYVERTLANGSIRRGLVGAIDLEIYDYSKGTVSLCRPTEATVASRLPARAKMRSNAVLEMPHIMMLLNDPDKTVVEQFEKDKEKLEKLYDFDLMMNSGHICGYRVTSCAAERVNNALEAIFNCCNDEHPMLFAMGDGNHSLAAAKLYYEQLKSELGNEALNHPARYALLELVNLYDDSLEFEPIHRVVFDVDTDKFLSQLKSVCVPADAGDDNSFNVIVGDKQLDLSFKCPETSVTVGNVQNFIDRYTDDSGGYTDYIHGEDVVRRLAAVKGRVGFIVKGISKDSFFDSVRKDGILPRKTFSMGNAADKRFYLECRKIDK